MIDDPEDKDPGVDESDSETSAFDREKFIKDEFIRARKKSIDLLARREHSTRELREKLRTRDFLAETIDSVIEFLIDRDYLSDRRYAEVFVRLRAEKGYGERFIRLKLKEKGVSPIDISEAVTLFEMDWDSDWQSHADNVLDRKMAKSGPTDESARRARLVRFMQSRGFTFEQTMVALEGAALRHNTDDTDDSEEKDVQALR